MISGILYGLGAALAQSVSYFFTRLFVIRRHQGVMQLLVLGHLIMAAVSLVLLPTVWPAHWPELKLFAGYLCGTAVFYFLGQVGMFYALRHMDASRASPLLGLKIVILAAITVGIFREHLGVLEWIACLLGVGAAVVLSFSGGTVAPRAMAGLLFACLTYSLSDINITRLVGVMDQGQGLVRASLLAVFLAYVLCGVLGLMLWPLLARGSSRADWLCAAPFAASWLIAMICLFACFGSVGVVLGNIVQSTRGLMTVGMGAVLAAAGLVHLERRSSAKVFIQRASAAALMFLAVAMFVYGKSNPHAAQDLLHYVRRLLGAAG